jgi:hypothetical protein
MHDKLQVVSGPILALPDHHVIALSGRDAIAFAQAQFMSDIGALSNGQWQWSGWLTPKGRVIALFALLRLDDETLWLVLPDADPANVADRLKGFVFRSKVSLDVRDELAVAGRFGQPDSAQGHAFAVLPDGTIELDMGGDAGPRSLRILPEDAQGPNVDANAEAQWRMFDLAHGLPRLSGPQVEHWTPQQLSLERLQAYSVRKGCYPGQEIVARTHFLGKAKRGLTLIASDDALAAGQSLRQGDATLGTIIATGTHGARSLALAVTPLDREAGPLDVDGVAVLEQPLRDGLAR